MKRLFVLFSFPFFLFTCEKEPEDPKSNLELDIENLAPLGADEQYEGWIIVDGSPVSTGTFTVDASGNLSETSFEVSDDDLSAATDFVLSIEPVPDNDPAPSDIKLLGGSFSGSMASVSVAHGAALGDDLSSGAGKYILATPTTTTTDDEMSGIWFLSLESGSPMAGLNLPTLPANWVYEGWVVIDGMPVTTGRFSDETMADYAAPYSGSDASGPPFPGEDFVMNAPAGLMFPTDLSGGKAVISIEPEPDNDAAPFQLKPLVADIPASAQDHLTYALMNKTAATFPTGKVKR